MDYTIQSWEKDIACSVVSVVLMVEILHLHRSIFQLLDLSCM